MSNVKFPGRVGEIYSNKFGTQFKIIEYQSSSRVIVQSIDEYHISKMVYYRDLIRGSVLSPYDKTVCGVGYLGTGEYLTAVDGVLTLAYSAWKHMMDRCYNDKSHTHRPTYAECTVAEEWHNYQNFAKWWNENYYQCNNETMCLDKDIATKGNKIYGPDTCLIVPQRINTLIESCKSARKSLPVGVSVDPYSKRFRAACRILCDGVSKKKHLGLYDTPNEAFEVYKNYKEKYIQSVANEYKSLLPENVYNAIYNYKITIDD